MTHDDDNRHRNNATTQEPRHDNTARRDTTLAMYYDTMDKTPRRRNDHTMMKNHGTTRHDSSHILRHNGQDITAAQQPHHDVTTPQRRDHDDATTSRCNGNTTTTQPADNEPLPPHPYTSAHVLYLLLVIYHSY
ncbi:hypothetical protein K443DRAFT_12685 [Laccaria amethystina LaAM-08-1]|uniref:Uncharacterized protein n=1 Tax=Laccaria amethystina LaAM-08-1 TaxID=1095629 RepID=A0A0C9WIX4_9AGAR|nr:hypothetical protein K443DRAFT_12685 [Laccaria amethystina LaAM-08-1]